MGNKKSHIDPTILTEEIVDLLVANTTFSKDEVRSWHTGFVKDCPKGKLDKKKFREVYQSLKCGGNVEKFCDLTFKAFDTDNNGTIDFYEFMLALAATQQGNTKDRLSAAFDIYDIDKNGVIDLKEMIKVFTAVYELNGIQDKKGEKSPKRKAELILNRMDKSGKKRLTKSDFIKSCLEDEDLKTIFAPYA
ncbi:hypothetical protein GJ496_002796 [Pomphorhynchus laevis]|nr:hypothetical protein GJ496_002796 [Pomphorhynchus laevis]